MEKKLLEDYISQAEQAFDREQYMEGKNHLEQALMIDPRCAKAHNHLGWVYLYHLNDWEKAETHLKHALKNGPRLSSPYIHMAYFLLETGQFEKLEEILDKAMKVNGVQKAYILSQYGRMHEVNGKFKKAIQCYKKAVRWAFEDREISTIRENIRRARRKRWISLF